MSIPQRLLGSEGVPFDLSLRLNHAADEFDIQGTKEWLRVREISPKVRFKELEIYGGSSIKDGDKYYAPASLYVEFVFDEDGEEFLISENLLARAYFKLVGDDVKIERIVPDLSSYTEG